MKELDNDLSGKHCTPCEGGTLPIDSFAVEKLLQRLEGWEEKEGRIEKLFQFKNHFQTMTFVNAIAWISLRENHHPDLHVGYNTCRVSYTTHAINGLSKNDFICAAKVDELMKD